MNKVQRLDLPYVAPLGDEIEREMARISPRNEQLDNVPGYVTHDPNVTRVGRLTSEAVAIDYEAAAKAIDEMGKQLTKLQAAVEEETQKVHAALLETMAVAEKYRDAGMRAFKRIEASAVLTQEVRDTCTEMVNRLEQGEK